MRCFFHFLHCRSIISQARDTLATSPESINRCKSSGRRVTSTPISTKNCFHVSLDPARNPASDCDEEPGTASGEQRHSSSKYIGSTIPTLESPARSPSNCPSPPYSSERYIVTALAWQRSTGLLD